MASPTNNSNSKAHWPDIKEAGTLRGILFLAWVQKIFGRYVFSIILYPVAIYFFLFRPASRKYSLEFLRTHHQQFPDHWQRCPGFHDVILHFFSFGQSILDKLLAWTVSTTENEFETANDYKLENLLDDSEGQLIIGSHFGNLEYCRGFIQRNKDKVINALVYDRHSANYVRMMQKLNPMSRVHIYQVDELDIPLILKFQKKLNDGEWLFVAGDRLPLSGPQHTVEVDFMGRRANFPIGPYVLAKSLGCKVKFMFAYRCKSKVRLAVVPVTDKVVLPHAKKTEQLTQYAQQFATEMQKQCEQAPLQWFNFFPFWIDSQVAADTTKANP